MFDYLIKNALIVDGNGGAPYKGDIAIEDGLIAAIGTSIDGDAGETIDASGAYAAPGWVDIHTHYDGQVSWDSEMDPSASHGVTTLVMGNCGVGFAPARPGTEKQLIELMEGVEDIPGTALYEGIEWGKWETFPEYLDYLDTKKFALDVGAQVPHSALRYYVMGDRSMRHEDATQADLDAMSKIVKDGIEAGALGFSTSRTIGHRDIHGKSIPGTFAEPEELIAIGHALKEAGKGVYQVVPAGVVGNLAGPERTTPEEEVELFIRIAEESGRPLTYTLTQVGDWPEKWRDQLDMVSKANANGLVIRPQFASRPIGFVVSLKTYNMFQRRKTFLELKERPFEEMLAEMRKPEVKAQILADEDIAPSEPGTMANIYGLLGQVCAMMYPLDVPMNYEPEASEMLGVKAEAAGMSPEEYMYDFLLEKDGNNFGILLGANYVHGNFDAIHEMMLHPETVVGLSDAGAHVNLIFDAVAPTYQISHWVRDRTRGPKLPIEFVVNKQTKRNADLYGLNDRGSLEVGKRADLNIFDLDRLNLGPLEQVNDLPAGGSRIVQPAEGYLNTFVNGVMTRRDDKATGELPGRLVRG